MRFIYFALITLASANQKIKNAAAKSRPDGGTGQGSENTRA